MSSLRNAVRQPETASSRPRLLEGERAYTSFRCTLCRVNDLIAMAIYHLYVKVIGRKTGSSAVAPAAYCSGSRSRDERLDFPSPGRLA